MAACPRCGSTNVKRAHVWGKGSESIVLGLIVLFALGASLFAVILAGVFIILKILGWVFGRFEWNWVCETCNHKFTTPPLKKASFVGSHNTREVVPVGENTNNLSIVENINSEDKYLDVIILKEGIVSLSKGRFRNYNAIFVLTNHALVFFGYVGFFAHRVKDFINISDHWRCINKKSICQATE